MASRTERCELKLPLWVRPCTTVVSGGELIAFRRRIVYRCGNGARSGARRSQDIQWRGVRFVQAAGNPTGPPPRYVWDSDSLLPSDGLVEVTIGGLPLKLDLRFPHERRYALGLLHGLRNPQADIDRQLFQKYVRSGDVVLDAGANVGVTVAEALACGAKRVICVEPEHALVTRLRALESRAQDRMCIWHCALGAEIGFAELLLSQAHNQGHTISPKMTSMFPELFDGKLERVDVSTIDIVIGNQASDIWKLDVEGSEVDAIRGARRTLERSPPRLIFAELYDPFVDEFIALLSRFQVKRAALSKASYTLQLLDQVGGSLSDDFCQTSPTYVFARNG
jgi:FkbM family methyltransferase